MRTTTSTLSALIASANQYRMKNALSVICALEVGETPDLSALQQPASKPVAFGFSDNDLAYWRDSFASRLPEYEDLRTRALAFVSKMNVQASRDGGRLSNEDRSRRDAAYDDAKWAGNRIRAISAFSSIVTKIVEDREIAARPAAPVGWLSIDTKAEETTIAILKPIEYKKPAKRIKPASIARCEMTLSGFGDLKEYIENNDLVASMIAR